MYPGYGTGWVRGGAIPVPSLRPSQDPIFSIFKAEDPTHGQMKANSQVSMRFPRKGPDMVLELTRIDPESTLRTPSRDWSPDDPQIPISLDLRYLWARIGTI